MGDILILQLNLSWNLNDNTNTKLLVWRKLGAAICNGDVVYNAGDPIPNQTNSSGTITLNDVELNTGITTFNAMNGILMNATSEFGSPAEVHLYAHGCDEGAPLSFGGQSKVEKNQELHER